MSMLNDAYCMAPHQFIFAQDSEGRSLCDPTPVDMLLELTHINRATKQQINIVGKQVDGFDVKVFDAIHALFGASILGRDPLLGKDEDQWVLISTFDKLAKSIGIRSGPKIKLAVHDRLAASLKKFTTITYRIGTVGFDESSAAACHIESFPLVGTLTIFDDAHEFKNQGDFLIKLNPISNKLQVLGEDGALLVSNYGQYSHLVRADALGCTNYSAYQILRRISHQVQMPKTQSTSIKDIQLDTLVAWCYGKGLTGQKLRNARYAVVNKGLTQIDALANWKVARSEISNVIRFERLAKPKINFKKL